MGTGRSAGKRVRKIKESRRLKQRQMLKTDRFVLGFLRFIFFFWMIFYNFNLSFPFLDTVATWWEHVGHFVYYFFYFFLPPYWDKVKGINPIQLLIYYAN